MAKRKLAKLKLSKSMLRDNPVAMPLIGILKSIYKIGFINKVLRILIPPYVRNSWKELKEVTWPNRKETWRLIGAVLSFTIILGVFVSLLDKGLDIIFKNTVLK